MGLGFTEIVILAAIALVVMGPEKFPDFAKIVVRTMRDLRGYMDDVKSDLSKELRPVQKEIKQLSRYDVNTYLNTKEPKKPATTTPETPKEGVDAQNVADPGVAGETTPYEGPKTAFDTPTESPSNGNTAAIETPAKTTADAAEETYRD